MPAPKVERRKIADYRPDPANPNKHSERGVSMLEDSLASVGLGRSIVVDKNGIVLAGNSTQERAIDQGFENAIEVESDGKSLIVVRRTDLNLLDDKDNRARKLSYYDNRSAELGIAWDADQLLADINAGVDLSHLFSTLELDELLAGLRDEAKPDAGAQIDRAAELAEQYGTAVGQVWQLGKHRLAIGDCTDKTVVDALMQGEKPLLMVTDPPYGVEYDPGWRNDAAEKGLIAFAASREGVVANDNRVDWTEAWKLSPCNVVYCWHADRHASAVQNNLESAGFEIRCQIIWSKPRFVISRGHYHWQHEPCWYAVRKGETAEWCGDRSQTTLWEIPQLDDIDQKTHGTQKPTECMERPIRNHSGDVYDPFVGSGTTIIAAERQGRRCFAIEIEPSYAAVSIQRWEVSTGERGVLMTG